MARGRFFAAVVFLATIFAGWLAAPVMAQVETAPQRMPAYGIAPDHAAPSSSASLTSPVGVISPYDVPLPGVTATASPVALSPNFINPAPVEASPYISDIGASWSWQVLPEGLMYRSYMAGGLEPRLGSQIVHERGHGWYWNAQVGARVGILRYGDDTALMPQGWQFDVEGAAFPRLDLQSEEDLAAADFRGGCVLTNRQGIIETKFGFYHLSSHLGDEYMIKNPGYRRINYVRESLVLGAAVYPWRWVRLYAEAGWTFQEDGGAQPWEFQFGADVCSPDPTGARGTPFLAVNGHLRQENDFGGNFTVQTGWLWRGMTGRTFRVGLQYFNGMSEQYQFYDHFAEQIGFGLWYDF